MKAISSYLKSKLKLTINEEKSGIRKPVQFTILGFGFVPTYKKGDRGKYQLVVSEKAWKRLKQNLKAITRKTTPMSFDETSRLRWMVEESSALLHLERLEKA